MAATYNNSLPTPKDRARLELNDRGTGATGTVANPVFQDEEIEAVLARYSWPRALYTLARTAAQYFSRLANEWEEADVKKKYTDRAKFYEDLMKSFETHGDPDNQPAVDTKTGVALARRLAEPDLCDYRPD